MRTFKIAFTVGIDALSTVVSLLAAEVNHFEVNETKETEAPACHNRPKHFPARPIEDQSCGKIILTALADGKAKTREELGAILQKKWFFANKRVSCDDAFGQAG